MTACFLPWLPAAAATSPPVTATPASSGDGIGALSRSLETAAFDLFTALTRGEPPAGESLLLHAHNFLGAARSFAHLANDRGADRELLTLSFTLLAKEAQLLEPLLPERARQSSWAGVTRTLESLRQELDAVPPHGAPGVPPAEPDPDAPRVELENDGWHGSLLDRFVRIKGKLSGTDLERCDVIVTDAKNRIIWTGTDQVGEVKAYYRTKGWARGRPATIRFSLRLPEDHLTVGTNFITFKLVDAQGRQAFETVVAGR